MVSGFGVSGSGFRVWGLQWLQVVASTPLMLVPATQYVMESCVLFLRHA